MMSDKEKYEEYLQKAQQYVSIARMHEAHKNITEAQKYYRLARDFFDLASAIKPPTKNDNNEEVQMAEECWRANIDFEYIDEKLER